MGQVLLISNSEHVSSMLSLNLQIHLGLDVIHRLDYRSGVELLSLLPEISLVILQEDYGNKSLDSELSLYMTNNEIEAPLIVLKSNGLTELKKISPSHSEVSLEHGIEGLMSEICSHLGITAKDKMNQVFPDFLAFSIKTFYLLNVPVCDIFIRIAKTSGGHRYVKRIPKDEAPSTEFLNHYKQKGVDELYILKEDRYHFVRELTQSLLNQFDKASELSDQEVIEYSESGYNMIASLLKNYQFEAENLVLVETQLNVIEELVSRHEGRLQELIEKLIQAKTSYLFQRIILTSYLCLHVSKRMDLLDKNLKEQTSCLNFVSFFRDILLDRKAYIDIKTLRQLGDSKLNPEEKELVRTHPARTVQLLEPLEVHSTMSLNVILQHHGSSNGIGFPTQLSEELIPLTYIFMACESYSDEILNNDHQELSYTEIVEKLPKEILNSKIWNALNLINNKAS